MSVWLKARRNELGISQEEVATRLQLKGYDISRGVVSHWETGRNLIPLDNPSFVEALADTLEIGVMELFSMAGYIQSDKFSDTAIRAASMIDQMSPGRQQTALVLLEQLLKEG